MAVSEYLAAALTFTPAGGSPALGTATNGTWTLQADSNAVSFAAGGAAMRSSHDGDQMTFACPTGTTAVYLKGVAAHACCDLVITIDGHDCGHLTQAVGTPNVAAQFWGYGNIVARHLDPAVAHTITLTVVGGLASTYINSLILVDNNPIVPQANRVTGLGDSWLFGGGSSQSGVMNWFHTFAQMLRAQAKNLATLGWTEENLGVTGDAFWTNGPPIASGQSQYPGKRGGFSRLIDQCLVPETIGEWFGYQYGPNDLANISAGDHGKNLDVIMSLIEDAVVYKKFKKAMFGTPGYVTNAHITSITAALDWSQVNWFGDMGENYELAVDAVYEAASAHPWAAVAPVYESMDERASLVYPNANNEFNGDIGGHPGDGGHRKISTTYYATAMGVQTNPFGGRGAVMGR